MSEKIGALVGRFAIGGVTSCKDGASSLINYRLKKHLGDRTIIAFRNTRK